jgi:hypothetical protein
MRTPDSYAGSSINGSADRFVGGAFVGIESRHNTVTLAQLGLGPLLARAW